MKIIILGSSGFIGSNIVDYLERNTEYTIIPLNHHECDLTKQHEIENKLCPILAGSILIIASGIQRLTDDSIKAFHENIDMINNICSAALQNIPKHIIFLSSVEVYGNPEKCKITETTALAPETHYAISKLVAENLLRICQKKISCKLTILRLPGVYGFGAKNGFIASLIKSIKNKIPFHFYGNGEQLRDYVYVKDIAMIVLKAIALERPFQILNITTGSAISLDEIVKITFNIFGETPVLCQSSSIEGVDLEFDTSELQHALGHFSFTALQDGLLCWRNAYV